MAGLRYPRYDLDTSIQAARTLYEKGGGAANADAFAEYLGYKSANNGAFLARVGAARLFGLLEGPSSETKPSARAMEILKPDYDYVATRARLEAFREVPLFGAFLTEYEGKPLPPKEGMLNALERLAVPKDAAPAVLSCLMNSAEQAGLFVVTGDRTKMIRPPLSGGTPAKRPVDPGGGDGGGAGNGGGLGRGKLLDGVIEALPATDKWTEDLFQDWLDMLAMAVRVRYQLPKPKGQRAEKEVNR